MKRLVYKRKVDTPDYSLAHIVDTAADVKEVEDQLRRTTRDLRTRVSKCTELYGEANSVKKHNYKIWLNDDVY